jgi:hypothetical protein
MTGHDMANSEHDAINTLADTLERDLLSRYGPLIGQDDLRRALGYPSMDAFRQASARKQLPIPVFPLQNRRGKYALVKDLAGWLAMTRQVALQSSPKEATTDNQE